MSALLPKGFAALEPFVATWSVEGADKRDTLRCSESAESREEFYTAIEGRIGDILTRLDQTPLTQHSAAEHRLMLLALSYAHVSPTIVTLGAAEARHAMHRRRLPITRASSDG